jgi:hypothetical protein
LGSFVVADQPNQVSDDSCHRLPFPIALPASRCHSRQALASPESRFLNLAWALESLVRFLALVMVSGYLQQGAFTPELNGLIREKLGQPLSLGSLLELCREVVRACLAEARELQVVGLVGLLSRIGRKTYSPSEFMQGIEELIAWRNSVVHPRSVPDLAGEVERRQAAFDRLLGELKFLADYQLAVPLKAARGDPGTVTAKLVCMGDRPFIAVECRLEVPGALRGDVVLEESPVLLDRLGKRVLMVLYPFVLFDVEPLDELYSFLQSSWRSGVLYRLNFGPSRPQVAPLTIVSGESPARDQVLAAFQRRLAAAYTDQAQAAKPDPDPMRSERSFDIPSVSVEIEYLLRLFVGRGEQADALAHWLDRHERGYVFYEAAAGAGKSAYAALLVDRFDWPVYLVKREARRDRPERFVPYLIWRLMERHGLQDHVPEDPGELSDTLARVLTRVARRLDGRVGAREVIVLDGLNELDPDTNLGFLPAVLPPRVFVIVLSQPCPLLELLRTRVAVDRTSFGLAGLSESEVHRLLDLSGVGLSESERRQIVGRANGWPLYLRMVIDAHRAGEPWKAVPESLEELYDQVVAGVESGSPALVVLGVLWAAAEPLGVPDLAEITGMQRLEVRTALSAWRPYLLSVRRRVSIYHETFREYLGREVFGPVEAAGYREALVAWCERALTSSPYALRHLARHLCELGRFDDAVEVATRDDVVSARLQLFGNRSVVLDDLAQVEMACYAAGRKRLSERVAQRIQALKAEEITAEPGTRRSESADIAGSALALIAPANAGLPMPADLADINRRLKQAVYVAGSPEAQERARQLLVRVNREAVVARLDELDARSDPGRAIALLEEALSVLPDEYPLYQRLAAVLAGVGDWPRLYAVLERSKLAPLAPEQHADLARYETQELVNYWQDLPTPIPPEMFPEIRARLNELERRFRDTSEFLAVSGLYLYALIGQTLRGPFPRGCDGPDPDQLVRAIDEYEAVSRRYQALPPEVRTPKTERVMRKADDQILRVARAAVDDLHYRSRPLYRVQCCGIAGVVWSASAFAALGLSVESGVGAPLTLPVQSPYWSGATLLVGLAVGAVAAWTPSRRQARWAVAALLLAGVMGFAPLADHATHWRGPIARLAAAFSLVVLGGLTDAALLRRRRPPPSIPPLAAGEEADSPDAAALARPDRSIAIFGAPASGRSSYTAGLLERIRAHGGHRGFSVELARECDLELSHILRRSAFVTPRRLGTELCGTLRFRRTGWRRILRGPIASYGVFFLDPSGENFSTLSNAYEYMAAFDSASALIWTVSPHRPPRDAHSAEDVLAQLVNYLRRSGCLSKTQALGKPLAIVLTMCDLPDSPVPHAELERLGQQGDVYDPVLAVQVSNLVERSLLDRAEFAGMVRVARSNFRRVAFFAVSAIGRPDGVVDNLIEREYAPYRLDEPLLWVLHLLGEL